MNKLAVAALAAFLIPAAAPAAASGASLDFRLKGGYAYAAIGDFNAYNDDILKTMDWILPGGYRFSGEFPRLHGALDLEFEASLSLSSRLRLSLSAGFLEAKGGPWSYSFSRPDGTFLFSDRVEPYARAIPVKLSISFNALDSPRFKAFIKGGLGVYFARFYSYSFDDEGWPDASEMRVDTTATGVGVHGGVGFEAAITSHIGLVVEAEGRYAPIDNFTGTAAITSGGVTVTTNGTIYYYRAPTVSNVQEFVLSAQPPPSLFSDIRKAIVDFSGFTIRGGLVIHF
ncbi:MAG: outer membrane beta-barrel protein [Candidatus Aminicenantales bacterium]|jgi:hypothetical protein